MPSLADRLNLVILSVALLGFLVAGCMDDTGASANGTTSEPDTSAITTPLAPTASALDGSDACAYIASTITIGLAHWASSQNIVNAPIAETRLGLQPEGGVPGIMVDGCVWEARGTSGGHIGVAVERFTSVDMDELAGMASDESIQAEQLTGGRSRWNVPPSGESPSGAVLIGDDSHLVVVRLESYSDNIAGTFLATVRNGSEEFFKTIGDTVEASGSK